jgi:hypothetical protein
LATYDEYWLTSLPAALCFAAEGDCCTYPQCPHRRVVKSTPATIVHKLHNAIVVTMSSHSTKERLKEFGSVLVAPARRSPEYLQKFIQSEIEKWAAVIKAASIKTE